MKKAVIFSLGMLTLSTVSAAPPGKTSAGVRLQADNAPAENVAQATKPTVAEEIKLVAPGKAKVAAPSAAKPTAPAPGSAKLAPPEKAQPVVPAPAKWSGKVSAGLMAKTGNTENSTFNAKVLIRRESGDWQYQLRAAAHSTQKKKETTEEDYLAFLRANYSLSPVSYLFGVLGFKSDRFAGYNRRYIQSVGYGHELIETKRHKLWGEIGTGIRQNHLVTGERQQDWIVRVNLAYKYQFAEKSAFEQTLQAIGGPDNTTTSSETALSVPIINNFGIKLSYSVEHNTDVPVNTEKTDTRTSVNLQYSF